VHEIIEELVPPNLMYPRVFHVDDPRREIESNKRGKVLCFDFRKGLVVESSTPLISNYGFQSGFDTNQLDIEGSISMTPDMISTEWRSPPSSYVHQ
jgi:hypothetical protein